MKTRNEFIISTHMAGTWTSEGITKGLSVWTGMTVAKSQTHTAHRIRCVCCNQHRGRVEVLTGDHFKCGLYRRRTGTTFKCSRTHKYFDFPLRRLRFLAFRSEFAAARRPSHLQPDSELFLPLLSSMNKLLMWQIDSADPPPLHPTVARHMLRGCAAIWNKTPRPSPVHRSTDLTQMNPDLVRSRSFEVP